MRFWALCLGVLDKLGVLGGEAFCGIPSVHLTSQAALRYHARMEPGNLLFIISDQHQAAAMGCAGHPLLQTPNLDALAAGGTRFSNAYTNCAICVPARASLATGRYVHEIGNWDNGLPYDGSVPSWGHRLKAAGYRVDSIGKLHFRSADDDNGFTREIEPMHVVEGIGDPASGIRDGSLRRDSRKGKDEVGPGDSTYQQYDRRNRDNAIRWLHERAGDAQPWALFLSFVTPHPPFLAPPETYALYPHEDITLPPQWDETSWPRHPTYDYMRQFFCYERAPLMKPRFAACRPLIMASAPFSTSRSGKCWRLWTR